MKKILSLLILSTCLLACSDDDNTEPNNSTNQGNSSQNSTEYRCESGSPNIVGARCKDGSRSDATGQGACSRHGGVDYWLCR